MSRNDATDSNIKVPLLDIVGDNRPLRDEMMRAIAGVVDSGRFLHGPECRQLEAEVARRCQTAEAVSCASGSDALLLAVMALGIGPGDEVILPSFTFFATASCIWRVGARPVFVDIDPATFNLNPDAVQAAITDATRAIIPVHLFGQCAAMDRICELASKHGLAVIEDAAQSIGAAYRKRAAGSWGRVGCFSFYPTKNLGGIGDGGIMTTDDSNFADRLRLFAGHGMQPRYYHQVVGINSRLDTIQAAALGVKIRQLDAWNELRQQHAARYRALFDQSGLEDDIRVPSVSTDQTHVWNQYTVRVCNGRRDALRAFLAERHIGTEIYYPVPLHQQACFASLGYQAGSLPATETAASEVLSLPVFPGIRPEQQEAVVDGIGAYYRQAGRAAA